MAISTEIQVGLVVGFFTLLGSAIPKYLQYRYKKEERKQIELSKLEGLKVLRKQLYVSRFEAFIFSDYHEFRNKTELNPSDFSEAKRWMQKCEDLGLELAKTNQNFLESLGMISILFSCSKELNELIEKNRELDYPIIERPNLKMSMGDLENYKIQAVKDLQIFVDEKFRQKMDALINKLRNDL